MIDTIEIVEVVIKGGIILFLALNLVPLLVYLERKISAFMQDRIGPENIGLYGVIQPLADALKFILKEWFEPPRSQKFLYYLGPFLTFLAPSLAFAGISLTRDISAVSSSLSILILLAFSSMGVWGIILGGWSSDNKFSLLGAIRAASQFISYEVALSLSIVAMLITYGTFNFVEIVSAQNTVWGILKNPIAFIVAFISAFAETGRIPFDLPEAEAELVAGYHTEYSGMKFAVFFMGEYIHLGLSAALITLLFLGGWNIPFIKFEFGDLLFAEVFENIIDFIIFSVKFGFILFLFIAARWTLPRFRFDQVTKIGWGYLIPLGFIAIFISIISL